MTLSNYSLHLIAVTVTPFGHFLERVGAETAGSGAIGSSVGLIGAAIARDAGVKGINQKEIVGQGLTYGLLFGLGLRHLGTARAVVTV